MYFKGVIRESQSLKSQIICFQVLSHNLPTFYSAGQLSYPRQPSEHHVQFLTVPDFRLLQDNPHLKLLESLRRLSQVKEEYMPKEHSLPNISRKSSIEMLQASPNQLTVREKSGASESLSCKIDILSRLGSRLSLYSEIVEADPSEYLNCRQATVEDLKILFQSSQMHVMVTSLALLEKYIKHSGISINPHNISGMFYTATILAYKLAYDEQLPGMVAHFSQKLSIPIPLLLQLQSLFLKGLNYDVTLSQAQIINSKRQLS